MGKRLFDLFFATGAILFFLPMAVMISILVLICSPGPLFYASERVGKSGQPVRCWKFRTMCVHADKKLHTLLQTSPSLKKEWFAHYKLKNDPRITFIGKFLRRTSLDELPQFFSVLKGDLSVVGPRPVTQEEITTYYREKADKIFSVKPGLTGLWQISGRNTLSFEQRVKLDEQYVEHRTFFLDLKIILKTIQQMFFSLSGC